MSSPNPADDAKAPRAPAGVRKLLDVWHKVECWIAVVSFGFIAALMLTDVLLRELVGPVLRLMGFEPGALGIFAAQKLSVFALVFGAFAGIGIATATGSHLVPRVGHSAFPASWGPALDRIADVITGVFLIGVAYYGFKLVASTKATDLRAPVLDWSVWRFQLAIPLGFLSAAGRYLVYAAWPSLKPVPPEFQE